MEWIFDNLHALITDKARSMSRRSLNILLQLLLLHVLLCCKAAAFLRDQPGALMPAYLGHAQPSKTSWEQLQPRAHAPTDLRSSLSSTRLYATITQQEAQKGIDIVVAALRKSKNANDELGRLSRVNNVLGYGSPSPGVLLLRFNASFQKGGFGRSSVPMPFGLGQTNQSEGRGTMVGQVKAQITDGKVTSCSVFRDLGYGRSFTLKC